MNLPAMIIDFEATDVSKEAEATQLGYDKVSFHESGQLFSRHAGIFGDLVASSKLYCQPDRPISFGAMAVSHISQWDLTEAPNHKEIVPQHLPEGEAYIIGHNVDFDIQVAANAGVDVSQYKAICTQALARKLLPDVDSHSLGALMYYTYPDRAREYCRNAHHAGWDVTFTRWLLEHLCELGNITSMEQLYLASEKARIPLTFTFGKNEGKNIKEMACHEKDRKYLHWVIDTIKDKPYLITACSAALNTIIPLIWDKASLPFLATVDNGDNYHVYYSPAAAKPYTALKKVGDQVVDDALFETVEDAKAWCNKHFNMGAFYEEE